MQENKDELLLKEEEFRYVTFPIKWPMIWKFYKKQVGNFWVSEEVDLSNDLNDWSKLSDNEQHFIKYVLAFFAASDGIVSENLVMNFCSEVKIMEAQYFYGFQNMMEAIHSQMYSRLIETYISDPKEKDKLFNAVETIPCIKKKAEWAQKWIGDTTYNRLPLFIQQALSNKKLQKKNKKVNDWVKKGKNCPSFAERLIAFAAVEGIFFSGSFCAIFWLKNKGIMPITLSNELISRDEGLHQDFACLLYSKLQNKLSTNIVHNIIKEAVEIEKEFIIESLPCKLIGMNSEKMSTYIEYVADRLLMVLGYPKLWNNNNPFPFMEMISLEGKTNFFERRVSEYGRSGININNDEKENNADNIIRFDVDF